MEPTKTERVSLKIKIYDTLELRMHSKAKRLCLKMKKVKKIKIKKYFFNLLTTFFFFFFFFFFLFCAAYTIGERMIPIEPMYMIWNLGMSQDFGEVDIENLPFPSYMMIDYIRVYQRPEKMNVGCSPPDMPTSQWINCHKNLFKTSNKDDILFGPCTSGAAARMVGLASFLTVVAVLVVAAAGF